MKGTVRFQDRTEMVNYVGGKGNWSPWSGPHHSKLAFIGWNISADEVLGKLRDCIPDEML